MNADWATADDIPALVELTGTTFASDSHTQLKALAKGYGSRPQDVARYHAEGSKVGFEQAIAEKNTDIVIVRDSNGSILGFAVWKKAGYDSQQPEEAQSRPSRSIPPPSDLPTDAPKTLPNLEKLTNAAMSYYVSHLKQPASPSRYMVGINVHPSHQGKGVGTRLTRWGTEKAEQEGAYCWVCPNGNAMPMFAKQGFVEVGRLEACLDDWAEGLKRPQVNEGVAESRWGNYVWAWMRWDAPPREVQAV